MTKAGDPRATAAPTELLNQIQGIVAAQLDDEGIEVDLDLWSSGMTSLQSVSVMLAVERACRVEFPEHALNRETFASVRHLAAAVHSVTTWQVHD